MKSHSINNLDLLKNILIDPVSKKKLDVVKENDGTEYFKTVNQDSYYIKDGVINLFLNHDDDKLNLVQSEFYNEIKFPNYDGMEDFSALIKKGEKSIFGAMLDREIPMNVKVLEAGCGTGQMSLFLSRFGREIFGIDLSIGSLKLAQKFKKENDLNNVHLMKMNLNNLFFPNDYFDVIISNGVLHHTSDPKKSFEHLTKYLKKDGIIIIGLYHRYGRLWTNIRQLLIKYFGNKLKYLDVRNYSNNFSKGKRKAWFNDQYKNPKESSHTYSEVLSWFDDKNIDFLSSIPFSFPNGLHNEKVFDRKDRESKAIIFPIELFQMFSPSQIREGGFFVMIGKKK